MMCLSVCVCVCLNSGLYKDKEKNLEKNLEQVNEQALSFPLLLVFYVEFFWLSCLVLNKYFSLHIILCFLFCI